MKKLPILLTVILIFFLSCESNQNISDKLNIVFENYYQESLKLYPMMATSQGDTRYNDFLPNNLSDEFRNNEKFFIQIIKNF